MLAVDLERVGDFKKDVYERQGIRVQKAIPPHQKLPCFLAPEYLQHGQVNSIP